MAVTQIGGFGSVTTMLVAVDGMLGHSGSP
jgi:hypothetical protein